MKKVILVLFFWGVCANFSYSEDSTNNMDNMDCQASAQEYTIPGTGTNFPFGIFRGLFTVIQTPVEPIRVGCTIVGAQRKKSPMLETCLLSFSLPISFVGGTVWDLESRSWRC